jgi:NAD(P)-dependent dehydrogenase (short-subunit alcohol dehydrogenase family)
MSRLEHKIALVTGASQGRADNPRLMRPEEIAEVAVLLASAASSAITASAIDAFGGTQPLFT